MNTYSNAELNKILELHESYLQGKRDGIKANLKNANLSYTNLENANLETANLEYANLYKANLDNANLYKANLIGALNISASIAARLSIVPEIGGFYGYKQLRDNIIAILYIPASAKRSNGTTRKCRASKAIVKKFVSFKGDKLDITYGYSLYSKEFKYTIGETVVPTSKFDSDRWVECGSGIHFFLTKQEAIEFNY